MSSTLAAIPGRSTPQPDAVDPEASPPQRRGDLEIADKHTREDPRNLRVAAAYLAVAAISTKVGSL